MSQIGPHLNQAQETARQVDGRTECRNAKGSRALLEPLDDVALLGSPLLHGQDEEVPEAAHSNYPCFGDWMKRDLGQVMVIHRDLLGYDTRS